VETALKALARNKSSVIDGPLFAIAAGLGKLIPPSWQAKMIGRVLRPSGAD